MGYKLYDQYTILSPAKSRMNWQPANGRVNMCSHIKAPLPPKVVRSIVWSLPLWVAAQSLNNSGESFTRQLQITFLILQQMQWKGNNGGVFPSLSMYSGTVNYILGDFLLKNSLDLNFHVSICIWICMFWNLPVRRKPTSRPHWLSKGSTLPLSIFSIRCSTNNFFLNVIHSWFEWMIWRCGWRYWHFESFEIAGSIYIPPAQTSKAIKKVSETSQ